ncbi:MAG: hypothetical protein PHI31_04630 [Desulfuromonadaceae bacterium]|nr:hypothetical protein [Desulfuromonadaceae bacterium]
MAVVNHAKKEINAKIVYYGPPGAGKNTALTYIYSRIKPSLRGELKSVPAGMDNLRFFDFSPFETSLANGYRLRLHVYTLTGTVTNPATWKMTLKGADGILIMVNPAIGHAAETRESVSQLRDFLSAYGVGLHETSTVLQFNSFLREGGVVDVAEMAAALGLATVKTFSSNAASGDGLLDALITLSRQVLDGVAVKEQHERGNLPAIPETPPSPAASTVATETMAHVDTELASAVQLSPARPLVTLLSSDIDVQGTTMKIPLEIHSGESQSRLVVTVSIALDSITPSA